jgi:hypothetical protein
LWRKQKHRAENVFSAAQNSNDRKRLALTGLEAGVRLIDDINAALATDQLVVAVALHQTLEGIADFHVHTYIWRKYRLN